MSKYNYFLSLERLADAQLRASRLLKSEFCGEVRKSLSDISDINRQSNSLCSEVDAALFSEFLPPIDRVSISACAHGLNRITGAAFELAMLTGCADRISRRSALCDEMSVCASLAELIYEAVGYFEKLNSHSSLPDTYAFRLCLNKGRGVHSGFATRLSFSDVRSDQSPLILGIEHYRRTEAEVYDTVIESILENI